MRRLQGVGASAGLARGPWVRIGEDEGAPVGGRVAPEAAPAEVERLQAAAAGAAAELQGLAQRLTAEGRAEEAGIFEAQAAMALDPGLAETAAERIRADGEDGIASVRAAAGPIAEQLAALDDPLLAGRAADVRDVAERIARRLAGGDGAAVSHRGPSMDRPAIVVAHELLPSVAAMLPRDRLLGFALETGSTTAHASILARAYGIPAVVGVPSLLAALEADGPVELAIDGATGELLVAPDTAAVAEWERRGTARQAALAADVAEAGLPAVTSDGVEVTLLANIGGPAEADRAVAAGAAGVGLFRTEFLFAERAAPPDEAEQLAAYAAVVAAFSPHPVTIRLLDIGGDKPLPYLPIPDEANPFLGRRAIRLADTQADLFTTQLRAAYRAAAGGPVKVMAPMVADAADVAVLLGLAERARRELDAAGLARGEVELGVMLEIPGAILVLDSYARRLRFASLGTNDLLQYTLAADRGDPGLTRYQDPLHPALLRIIALAVEAAARSGLELSVCGEMAGDATAARCLVGLGVRELSMAAASLGPVRRAIRAAAAADLATGAQAALDDPDPAAVRGRFPS
ncbi:MAG: phosphoenolpyruvate--protein phosphotransferase [Candidatus Limnocylindrales bacterium]